MEETIYVWMSLIGGGVLLVQVILQVIGLEHDTDGVDGHDGSFDSDGHGNFFFGVLSVKALVAFVAVFGLSGLTLIQKTDLAQPMRLLSATLAGGGAMFVVAWLMRMLHNLSSSGTLKLSNAVGHEGSCYLRVPARSEGRGKVTFELQGRSVELAAMTDGDEIQTGARVRIVEVLGDETVKVAQV